MKELRRALIGKKFIRTSPITGSTVEGEVKDINYRIELSGGKRYRVSFYLLSDNGIPYELSECDFGYQDYHDMINEIIKIKFAQYIPEL